MQSLNSPSKKPLKNAGFTLFALVGDELVGLGGAVEHQLFLGVEQVDLYALVRVRVHELLYGVVYHCDTCLHFLSQKTC